jgi:tRNA(Ile)-lysidine synthetase-like protein
VILGVVQACLARQGIERSGEERILVAVSGGVDSMVLAHAVAELLGGRRMVIGHVDHAVRPESRQDAQAVREYAHRLRAECKVERLLPGPNREARLRQERYRALRKQKEESGSVFVLTAHHLSDQAETVLMGFLRGASWRALRGIPERNQDVLRPLLTVPKEEIVAYAQRFDLRPVEDETNLEPRFFRNRVRKELLPLLETRYRVGLIRRLGRLARSFSEGSGVGSLSWDEASSDASSSRVSTSGFGGDIEDQGGCIQVSLCLGTGSKWPKDAQNAAFDADLFPEPVFRWAKPGDRVQGLGMLGRQKITEAFRAAGIPSEDRWKRPVVADAQGRVHWVPGVVRSGHALVGPGTRRVWVFCWQPEKKSCGDSKADTV